MRYDELVWVVVLLLMVVLLAMPEKKDDSNIIEREPDQTIEVVAGKFILKDK